MNNANHISDNQLRLIVADKTPLQSQSKVEAHISGCSVCQKRILELAANDSWRNEIVSNCEQLDTDMPLDGSFTSTDPNIGKRPGDEFDLQTVDRMLSEVLEPPTHPELLGRLGRYDVEGVIGCGGMGVVLRAFDRDLHRPAAIKMILPRLLRNGTAKQRFGREARAAAVILHPNVIAIYEINQTNDVPWFAMPLIAGPSLKTMVEINGPLPEREIVRIAMQVAAGLAAAHSQGLVHRDIKPENILVDNQVNRVVITDFGLARRETDESMTQTGMLAGTINYMSPEQSRGEELDARSDLFSLGSLIYFLSTGEPPFHSTSPMGVIHKISSEEPKKVQSLNNEISETLANTIGLLLEKSSDRRIQTASEVESFLNEYLVHLHQPHNVAAPELPRTQRHRQKGSNRIRFWCTAAASTACLTMLIIGAFYLGLLSRPKPIPRLSDSQSSVTPNVTLSEIAQFRQLATDEELLTEDLKQLENELNRFRQSISTGKQSFATSSFEDELLRLELKIRDAAEKSGL